MFYSYLEKKVGLISCSTHHNPCDVPCGGPLCSCGSEPGNEPSLVSWWSIHPSPVFGSAGLRYKTTQLLKMPLTGCRRNMTDGTVQQKQPTHESLHWRSHWFRWDPTTPSSCHSARRWTPSASGAWACWMKKNIQCEIFMGGGSGVIYKNVYTKTNKPTNHKLFKKLHQPLSVSELVWIWCQWVTQYVR